MTALITTSHLTPESTEINTFSSTGEKGRKNSESDKHYLPRTNAKFFEKKSGKSLLFHSLFSSFTSRFWWIHLYLYQWIMWCTLYKPSDANIMKTCFQNLPNLKDIHVVHFKYNCMYLSLLISLKIYFPR